MSLKRAINLGGEDAPAADPQQKSGAGTQSSAAPKTIYVNGKAVQARYVAVTGRASSVHDPPMLYTTAGPGPSTQVPMHHYHFASTGGFGASSAPPYGGGGYSDWSPRVHIQAVVEEPVGEVGDLQTVTADDVVYESIRLKTSAQLTETWIMVEWESVL